MSARTSGCAKGSVAAVALAAAVPGIASAGPIAVIDSLYTIFYLYAAIVVVLAIVALVLCRRIRNPVRRALARLAIIVFVFTPVPMLGPSDTSYYAVAFVAGIGELNLSGASRHGTGIFAHPFLLAYTIMFALFVPIVLAWMRIGTRAQRE